MTLARSVIACATGALLVSATAQAQSPFAYTNRAGTGPAAAGDPIRLAEQIANGRAKADVTNGMIVDPSIQTDAGEVAHPASSESINTPGAGLAPTWQGLPSFPLQRFPVVGHGEVHCDTLGWVDATGCFDITANDVPPYVNQGNQGGFWDATTRNTYGGQDARALGLTIYGRVPVAVAQPVASFTPVTAMVPNGAGFSTVYANRISFSTPLSPAQIAAIKPMQRVETSNAAGFFVAYVARRGLVDASGNPLPIVAADGSSILVDTWSRPTPAVAAGVSVQPNQYDSGPYTVAIDLLHQIDQVYGGWVINPNTLPYVGTAMSWEIVNYNNTAYVPSLPNVLYDPRGQSVGKILEGIDAGMTGGAGSTAFMSNGHWLVSYAAGNSPSAATPNVYGHLCPYAFGIPKDGTTTYNTTCLYSGGIPGHGDALVVQPYGNSNAANPIAFRVANDGTLTTAAPIVQTGVSNGISSGGQIRAASFITPGLVVSQSVAQLNSPVSGSTYQVPAFLGRLFVTGPSGALTIVFPQGPVDGQEFELDGMGGFSGLTLATSDGNTWESDDANSVTTGTVAIPSHRAGVWRFNAALTVWSRKS